MGGRIWVYPLLFLTRTFNAIPRHQLTTGSHFASINLEPQWASRANLRSSLSTPRDVTQSVIARLASALQSLAAILRYSSGRCGLRKLPPSHGHLMWWCLHNLGSPVQNPKWKRIDQDPVSWNCGGQIIIKNRLCTNYYWTTPWFVVVDLCIQLEIVSTMNVRIKQKSQIPRIDNDQKYVLNIVKVRKPTTVRVWFRSKERIHNLKIWSLSFLLRGESK